MTGDLFGWLVKIGGFAGVCLGFCFMYIRIQHNDLLAAMAKNSADKDAMIQKLLDLNDKWNETINTQIDVQEAQKQLLQDLKQLVLEQRASKPS